MAILSRKTLWITLIAIGGLALAALSVYAGMRDSGTVNVNEKIQLTDQSASLNPVNTNSQATMPNGGLRGKGKPTQPTTELAPVSPDGSSEEGDEEVVEGDGQSEGETEAGADETSEQPVSDTETTSGEGEAI